MTKVHGKRYAYKFDFHALMQACQSQGHDATGGYKYATEFSAAAGLFSASPAGYQCPKLNGLTGAHLQASLAHQQSLFAPPPSPWNWNHNSAAMAVTGMNNLSNLYSSAAANSMTGHQSVPHQVNSSKFSTMKSRFIKKFFAYQLVDGYKKLRIFLITSIHYRSVLQ